MSDVKIDAELTKMSMRDGLLSRPLRLSWPSIEAALARGATVWDASAWRLEPSASAPESVNSETSAFETWSEAVDALIAEVDAHDG